MNENNVEKLKELLRRHGFSNSFSSTLRSRIQQQETTKLPTPKLRKKRNRGKRHKR